MEANEYARLILDLLRSKKPSPIRYHFSASFSKAAPSDFKFQIRDKAKTHQPATVNIHTLGAKENRETTRMPTLSAPGERED